MAIYGLDVSHWTEYVDWQKVKTEGWQGINGKKIPQFVIAKCSESNYYQDDTYKYNIGATRELGILNGSYMYYRNNLAGVTQARYYYETYKAAGIETDLPPCVDVEAINNPVLTATNILACLVEVERLFGRRPMIYTGFYTWRDMVKSPFWSAQYPLWVARYGASSPLIPPPWKGYTIWQFSDDQGDENWFNGTMEDLYTFCGQKPPASVEVAEFARKMSGMLNVVDTELHKAIEELAKAQN